MIFDFDRLACISEFKNLGQELEQPPEWHLNRIIYEAYIRIPKEFQTAPKGRVFLESDYEFDNETSSKSESGVNSGMTTKP